MRIATVIAEKETPPVVKRKLNCHFYGLNQVSAFSKKSYDPSQNFCKSLKCKGNSFLKEPLLTLT